MCNKQRKNSLNVVTFYKAGSIQGHLLYLFLCLYANIAGKADVFLHTDCPNGAKH